MSMWIYRLTLGLTSFVGRFFPGQAQRFFYWQLQFFPQLQNVVLRANKENYLASIATLSAQTPAAIVIVLANAVFEERAWAPRRYWMYFSHSELADGFYAYLTVSLVEASAMADLYVVTIDALRRHPQDLELALRCVARTPQYLTCPH